MNPNERESPVTREQLVAGIREWWSSFQDSAEHTLDYLTGVYSVARERLAESKINCVGSKATN